MSFTEFIPFCMIIVLMKISSEVNKNLKQDLEQVSLKYLRNKRHFLLKVSTLLPI